MITLADDRLSFTSPEIARQLRAHVERQIGHILPEFLRPEERTALLAELESRWGFRRLDGEAQDRHRLRVRTLTADEIEAALRTAARRAAGLHDASFPALTIAFQRTLRIPDDGRTDPLPAGLGAFPLRSLDDLPATAPASWLQRGGVVMPMDQSEALWISFLARYPCAVKIAAGKINAVSGAAWTAELQSEPQDYVVVPGQPWLDGFSVGEGLIRQCVAMPLGAGDSVEEQLTGQAIHSDHPAGMSAGVPRARFWNCPRCAPGRRHLLHAATRTKPPKVSCRNFILTPDRLRPGITLMPKHIHTELEQEIVNTLIDTKAIDFDACGNIIAKFGARAAKSGTDLAVIVNRFYILACGWPGPEIRRLQAQSINEIGG